jgi:membrane associated rhomboid family serine protease
MDFSARREALIAGCLSRLAVSTGFHPVSLVLPELASYASLAPHVLARRLEQGFYQMILLVGCDSPAQLADAAKRTTEFAAAHSQLTADIRLRISCVGVGPGSLSRADRHALLAPVRIQQDHVVVRRFWLSVDERRLFAFHSPWGFAPSFELNPCDPDPNLFVRLVRRDRYLREPAPPAPSEDFHRVSLAREGTFLSGLVGRRVLVRAILTFNVLLWLLLALSGGSTDTAQLIRAGAKSDGLILAGQYWRLITPIFLHYGALHLVLNGLGLLIFGELFERLYGSMQFALLYFVAGIASVVTSCFFGYGLMVGASGAIFGLAGALDVYGYRYRARIPRRYGAMFGGGLLPLIGLNIVFGLIVPGIDNSAHLGGLAAGALVALFLRPLADEVTAPSPFASRHLAALLVLALVAASLVLAAVNFVRCPSIFDTDERWTLDQKVLGGLDLLVPASWVETGQGENSADFRSVCYNGRLEARRSDLSKGLGQAFVVELLRLGKAGFRLVGPPGMAGSLLNDLNTRGRVEVRMQGAVVAKDSAGAVRLQRRQVFLLTGKTLLSVGVEVPESDAVRFAPIQDRILSLLPE